MEHIEDVRDAAVLGDAPSVTVVAPQDGRHLVLVVRGEADATTSDDLRSALMSALQDGPESIRVDLSNLSFCDLAGSDALHEFADAAAARAIVVDFHGMSPLLKTLYTTFPPAPNP